MVKTDIWISQRTNTGTSSTEFVWCDEILKAKVCEVKVSFLLRLIFLVIQGTYIWTCIYFESLSGLNPPRESEIYFYGERQST